MSMLPGRRSTNIADYLGIQIHWIQDFVLWWYVDVPTYILGLIKRVNTVILDSTSLLIIVKGYLRPWKNDYNIAGWMVGLIAKTAYIPIATFILLVANAFMFGLLIAHLVFLPLIIAMILLNPFLTP